MSPALSPGDRFIARRLRSPRRGAVVFFAHPDRPQFWLAKRVIGLEGEVVGVRGGRVHIDGVELVEPWSTDTTEPPGEWEVPPLHIFVLSDARHRTLADSRTLGPVPAPAVYTPWFRYLRGGKA